MKLNIQKNEVYTLWPVKILIAFKTCAHITAGILYILLAAPYFGIISLIKTSPRNPSCTPRVNVSRGLRRFVLILFKSIYDKAAA